MGLPPLRKCNFTRDSRRRKALENASFGAAEESSCLNSASSWLRRVEILSNLRKLSLEQLLDSLEYSRAEFFRECATREGPSLETLRKVADYFEITVDDFIDNRIDVEWIRAPQLHEKFQAVEGSRLRTSIAVVNWIAKNHGNGSAESILRTLRIPKSLLLNPTAPVRLRLLCDLLREGRARGISESDAFKMGQDAMFIPENASVRRELSTQRKPKDLYEMFFAEKIHEFESNYDYKIVKLDSSSIVLRIAPYEQRLVENGCSVMIDRTVSIYRWGVASGLLRTLGLANADAFPIRLATEKSPAETIRLTWVQSDDVIPIFSRRRPCE